MKITTGQNLPEFKYLCLGKRDLYLWQNGVILGHANRASSTGLALVLKKKVEGVQYREIHSKGIPAINLHSSFRISMDTQLTGLGPPYA